MRIVISEYLDQEKKECFIWIANKVVFLKNS